MIPSRTGAAFSDKASSKIVPASEVADFAASAAADKPCTKNRRFIIPAVFLQPRRYAVFTAGRFLSL
jgi:hypothetical protein